MYANMPASPLAMAKGTASGSRTVEETEGQTRFTYQARIEGQGFLGLLSPLLGPMLRRRFLSDLQRLKALLETASPTSLF